VSRVLTVPNVISLARLALVPVFLWLLLGRDDVAAAGWLLGVIGSTDWIDGYLARRLDQVTKVGELLDPVADRLAVVAAVIGGLVADVLPTWFVVAIIVREAAVAIGALVIGIGARSKLTVRRAGKLATLLLYAAIAWLYLGVGYDLSWLRAVAWAVAIPGLGLYYVVAAQYVGDARRLMADGTGRV
jgi:cardiolipin synthase